jgi:vitamin-K-epoxide reductase (warfarin-sensitive)
MTVLATKKRYLALTVINLLALAISIYLATLHFKPDLSSVCVISEKWNCDIVNKSIYSQILGIPVSILGAVTYLLLLIFSIRGLFRDQKKFIPIVFLCLTGAVGFSLYLTGVEAFILKTFCIFCVTQQILILLEYGITLTLLKDLKSKP